MYRARHQGFRPPPWEFGQTLWAKADLSYVLESDPPPQRWVFDKYLPMGRVTVLGGAGGSSKSFLALTLACHHALGKKFGPLKPGEPGKVLLITSEERKDDIHHRLRAIFDWRMLTRDSGGNLHHSGVVPNIVKELQALKDVRLLVFDPLVAFNAGEENDNVEMALLMRTFEHVTEKTGTGILLLHHVNKTGLNTPREMTTQAVIRGASAIIDNARGGLVLRRMVSNEARKYGVATENAHRYVGMSMTKANYGPYAPEVWIYLNDQGVPRHVELLEVPSASVNNPLRQEEVLRAIVDNPGKLTQTKLKEITGITSNDTVQTAYKNLEDRRLIMFRGEGKNRRPYPTRMGRQHCADLKDDDPFAD